MKIEIKSIAGSLLFEGDFDCIASAVESALSSSTNLRYADLRYADLSYADLRYANLRYANLRYANLRYANLSSTDLRYADLRYANLRYANLKDGSKIGKSQRPCFIIGAIGSEQRQLVALSTNQGIRIMTGCFFGTIEEFWEAVKSKHGKNKHGKEYAAAISLIKTHFKIWKD